SNVGTPLMGGVHAIYVFSYKQKSTNGFSNGFDFPAYIPSEAEAAGSNFLQNKWAEVETNSTSAKRELYGSLTWVAYPMLNPNQSLLSTDVTIKLRINKEYKNFVGSEENGGRPMYSWSMDEIATELGASCALQEALELINVVPNPYNAFSEYERNKIDNRIKITNLPEKCTISIYTTNGKLVQRIEKDSPVTYQDWILTNHANIPVASGIYLIHVEVPGVGYRVLKAFIAMRMVDLQNF
ncbi:MAG: T9SS type A sorting domain-containing protein, partial [Bacteroidetes bacterium]|nr:T9SS type A sorting domain-containing protein [Bacteroidota bacterium]